MRLNENNQQCPSTLGEYYELTKALFGEDIGKQALDFLQFKIDSCPNGRAEKVLADDRQMRGLIFAMVNRKLKEQGERSNESI